MNILLRLVWLLLTIIQAFGRIGRNPNTLFLLVLIMLSRFVFTVSFVNLEKLYTPTDTDNFVSSVLYVMVVAVGFLNVFVYGLATIESFLRLWKQIKRRRIAKKILNRKLWCSPRTILAFLCTFYSLFTVLWMFRFVHNMWTVHLGAPIEFLHFLPALAVVVQTFANGFLICIGDLLKQQKITRDKDYKMVVSFHRSCNFVLALYAILNAMLAIVYNMTPIISIVVFVELISRFLLSYSLIAPGSTSGKHEVNSASALDKASSFQSEFEFQVAEPTEQNQVALRSRAVGGAQQVTAPVVRQSANIPDDHRLVPQEPPPVNKQDDIDQQDRINQQDGLDQQDSIHHQDHIQRNDVPDCNEPVVAPVEEPFDRPELDSDDNDSEVEDFDQEEQFDVAVEVGDNIHDEQLEEAEDNIFHEQQFDELEEIEDFIHDEQFEEAVEEVEDFAHHNEHLN